jgi:hypothetical protein
MTLKNVIFLTFCSWVLCKRFFVLRLLAKVVGCIDAVILAFSNLKFHSETSPKMLSKVKHFERLFCVFHLLLVKWLGQSSQAWDPKLLA